MYIEICNTQTNKQTKTATINMGICSFSTFQTHNTFINK